MPSSRMLAKASSSAVAQSIVRSRGRIEQRPPTFAAALELPVTGEAVGGRSSEGGVERARGARAGTAVCTVLAVPGRGERRAPARRGPARAAGWPGPPRARFICVLDHRVGRRAASTIPRSSSVAHPDLPHGRVRARLVRVEQGLGEGRLVAFVVPVAAVADQVDQEVPLEARAVRPGQAGDLDAGLRIVGVHVDDGNLEPAREAARVGRAVGLVRRRR